MKTGQYYLNKMPKLFRELFLSNLRKQRAQNHLESYFGSFHDFVISAFIWSKSNEGTEFWGAVSFEEIE